MAVSSTSNNKQNPNTSNDAKNFPVNDIVITNMLIKEPPP
jgi:hypothetical protein